MTKKRKPYNKSTGRDYSYDTSYESSDKQKKNRAARNAARRAAMRSGKVRKGDGNDVDHINSDTKDNSKKNLRVISRSKNRGRMKNGKRV